MDAALSSDQKLKDKDITQGAMSKGFAYEEKVMEKISSHTEFIKNKAWYDHSKNLDVYSQFNSSMNICGDFAHLTSLALAMAGIPNGVMQVKDEERKNGRFFHNFNYFYYADQQYVLDTTWGTVIRPFTKDMVKRDYNYGTVIIDPIFDPDHYSNNY